MTRRVHACVDNNWLHFEHHLWWSYVSCGCPVLSYSTVLVLQLGLFTSVSFCTLMLVIDAKWGPDFKGFVFFKENELYYRYIEMLHFNLRNHFQNHVVWYIEVFRGHNWQICDEKYIFSNREDSNRGLLVYAQMLYRCAMIAVAGILLRGICYWRQLRIMYYAI